MCIEHGGRLLQSMRLQQDLRNYGNKEPLDYDIVVQLVTTNNCKSSYNFSVEVVAAFLCLFLRADKLTK